MEMNTIRSHFDAAVEAAPDSVFLRHCEDGVWKARTFAGVKEDVLRVLAAFRRFGLEPSARPRVALMLENRPEWVVAYLALAGTGIVVVPMDPKLRAAEAAHVLRDSGAALVIAAPRQGDVLAEAAKSLPDLAAAVWVGDAAPDGFPRPSFAWRRMMEAVTPSMLADAACWYDAHVPDDDTLASLIYTSGTTGRPKGAMLTHGNFAANAEQTIARVPFHPTDVFLNVLPMFHAFSFTGNFLLPLFARGSTAFTRGLRFIADDMLEVHPTVLLAVPLLAEKLFQRVQSKIQQSLVASGLFKFQMSRRLVARKVIERFGGRLRVLGVGGAPVSRDTLEGFIKLGLFVLEGYGITECAPGVSYPAPDDYEPGTVGRPLDGMEWKIVDPDETGAGELLVKGPNVTSGYWNNPDGTRSAFTEDGFYRTGDIVRLSARGHICICGRTKALIVNREGKNIYPEEIEQVLEHAPLVKDVVVLGYTVGGEVGEHVGAIVVPDEDAVRAHLKDKALTREEMAIFITGYVQAACRAQLADYKLPRKIEVRFDPLERTSSMKVRRVVYKGALDEAGSPIAPAAPEEQENA